MAVIGLPNFWLPIGILKFPEGFKIVKLQVEEKIVSFRWPKILLLAVVEGVKRVK